MVLAFLTSAVLYVLGRRLYGETVGALAAGLYQVVPIFAAFGIGINTDPLLIFFWALSLLLMHWAWTTGSAVAWVLMGLAVGAGIVSKYTMAMFYPCALLFLLFSPAGRKQLRRPWCWLGLLVSLAAFLPLVWWNSQHDWVNFRHNLNHTRYRQGLSFSPANFGIFVASQLGVVTPVLAVLMVIALLKHRREDPLAFWFSVPVIAFFLLKSIQGEVLANWALAGYLTGLYAFVAYYVIPYRRHNKHVRRLVVAAIVIPVVATVGLYNPVRVVNGYRRAAEAADSALARHGWGLPKGMVLTKDPLTKLRGWSELGQEVSRLDAVMPGPTFIMSDAYPIASCLAFYVEDNPRTFCCNVGKPPRRMNQFDLWPGFHDKVGYNAILVTAMKDDKAQALPQEFQGKFRQVQTIVFRATGRDGPIAAYTIFLCHDFAGMPPVIPTTY